MAPRKSATRWRFRYGRRCLKAPIGSLLHWRRPLPPGSGQALLGPDQNAPARFAMEHDVGPARLLHHLGSQRLEAGAAGALPHLGDRDAVPRPGEAVVSREQGRSDPRPDLVAIHLERVDRLVERGPLLLQLRFPGFELPFFLRDPLLGLLGLRHEGLLALEM